MINKLLFVAVFFPVFLFADIESLKKDIHFKLYEEITTHQKYNTEEYWISVGKMQAFSEVISLIEIELLGM